MESLHVHQLLHGYRSGHGQIAASIRLSTRDSELVTRLSDLSGTLISGLRFKSYVTVYPLPGEQYFAIARTWPDPDAPRAGCVLTHTLLVPLVHWETLANVRFIDGMFRNPHANPDYDFAEPLSQLEEPPTRVDKDSEIDLPRARVFVARYFGQGVRPIVWFNAEDPDEYLWRLLEHLWPRLRRTFASCTFSLQQRVLNDRPFDLLFAPAVVSSRFAKLPAEHLLDVGVSRRSFPASEERWSDYWARALFSPKQGMPPGEGELPAWTELNDDPTVVRKLSLVHELRLRAGQSPTAGVGAMDVVESLAHDAGAALSLKRLILTDALRATAVTVSTQDAFQALQLIEDRLQRESFRVVAPEYYRELSSAASAIALRDPDTALQLSRSWMTDRRVHNRKAFTDGVVTGLIKAGSEKPDSMHSLQAFPEVAMELLRVEPHFAPTYLQIGGEGAPRVVADWLASSDQVEVLRQLRHSLLCLVTMDDKETLLPTLLQDVGEQEVGDVLNLLSRLSGAFEDSYVRGVAKEMISSLQPVAVRAWGSTVKQWSTGIASVVGSSYAQDRSGVETLLEDADIDRSQRARILAQLISDFPSNSIPHWLRDLILYDGRIMGGLVLSNETGSDEIEGALLRILNEVNDAPFAGADELLESVSRFEGRTVFRQLVDAAVRSSVVAYVAGNRETRIVREYLDSPAATRWLESASEEQIGALVVNSSSSGAGAVERAFSWVGDAPNSLYTKKPAVLPEIFDSLLPRVRQFGCKNVQGSIINIVRRAGKIPGYDLRQILVAKCLRFCFDNVHLPLSELVAEIFGDVYVEAIAGNQRPSWFASLFGLYEWDKGKDLRITLIETFLRSSWAPSDLAISAHRSSILRKIFKRLHRKYGGDDYIRRMQADLAGRSGQEAAAARRELDGLTADPDFYEEWD